MTQDRSTLRAAMLLGAASLAATASAARAQTATVPFYHRTLDHAGLFTVPGLTAASAATTRPDPSFVASVPGVINAGLLYWHPARAATGYVIVATENNVVAALDENTGAALWSVTLGPPVSRTGQCGNINPVGVTSTPVIDGSTGTLYVSAVVSVGGAPSVDLFAVSLANGAIVSNWPVDIGAGVRALGQSFDATIAEQRGALTLLGGTVYIPFGGYAGDCGPYHGTVAGVSTTAHAVVDAWSTAAEKGGIWAPGGIASDGASLYFATGNTANTTTWGGGEAVIRMVPSAQATFVPADYFSPLDWQTLDNDDFDLGGVSPTLITLPGVTPSQLVLGLGKDQNAYLLDRHNLGHVGTALQTTMVATNEMHSATARYTLGNAVMVTLNAHGMNCSGGESDAGVLTLRIAPSGGKPVLSTAWCAPLSGRGDPIVTTSDGRHDPIVWITGAEGDEALHAFAGDTGAALYTSAPVTSTIAHFSTLLVANKRLFVPAEGQVVAFDLP